MVDLYKNKTWLSDRYVTKKRNVVQIAEECKTSPQVINYWLTKYQLIRNQRTWKR